MAEYIKKEAALQVIDYAKQLTNEQIVRESGAYELLSDTSKACYDGIIAAIAMCKQLIDEAVVVADVQPVNQWISVKDRLPEIGMSVLIYYQYWYGDKIQVAKLKDDGMMFDVCGAFNIRVEAVTHWMPLPESPKGGDTE